MKTTNCILCDGSDLELISDRIRHGIKRAVLQCRTCELNFLEPQNTDLKEFYSEEYRTKYTHAVGKGASPQEIFDACLPFQSDKIQRITHLLTPETKLLDVGCSAGHFLHAAKPRVATCIGIELNRNEAEFVRTQLNFEVHQDYVENLALEPESFDVITSHHVLEHIENPISFLTSLRSLLAPDGHICIEVPNIQDVLLSTYNIPEFREFWFRDVHLFNFSPKTLVNLMEKVGFSGSIQSIVSYNVLNHMNWAMNHTPQATMSVGMSDPRFEFRAGAEPDVASELASWIKDADQRYKDLLNRNMLGDSILFIGQKV